MSVYVWPALLFIWLFCMGACIGSFLNVCIARLPSGRTPCWPGSHCFSCFQPIGLRDNIPLLSYWILRGRCRCCGATFSMRYFWMELLTGCLFAGYYFVEIALNVHGYQMFGDTAFWYLQAALFPPWSWTVFIVHAIMLSLLLTAAMIQWERGRPESSVIVRGCAVGVFTCVLFPWPFPYDSREVARPAAQPAAMQPANPQWSLEWLLPRPGPMPSDSSWATSFYSPRLGFTPWPVAGPVPAWLEGPLLGLITGLAGCTLGLALREAARAGAQRHRADALFRAAGDDGGVLAIAGSFLGWQPVFAGATLAYVAVLAWRYLGRGTSLPVSLIAAICVVLCWLSWTWIASLLAPICFSPLVAPIALALVAGLAYCTGLISTQATANTDQAPIPLESSLPAP